MKKIHFIIAFVLLSCQMLLAQKTISGVINGADGLSIPGVTIVEEGTNQSTITDFDGKYQIAVNSKNPVLIFSYLGYKAKKITVGNKNNITVVIEEDNNILNEVVVVGYGTQKKSDVTGAVASISGKTLEERPQVNIQQALQATMPGVSVNVNSNTASGASTSLLIRGRKSISGGSEPLIVLDGIIFSGSLSDININDVKSVEVLKDASSAAIYGSRGANGVVLVTTKKGKEDGRPSLNFSTYYGVDIPYNLPNMMDPDTFYKRKVERFGLDSNLLTETEKAVYASGTAVDWLDLALRDGNRSENNISISGGTKNSTYFVSGNYQSVEGVAVNDNFDRVGFRANLEVDITDWLKFGSNTLLSFTNKSGNGPSFTDSFYMNQLTVAKNPDGTLTKIPWPEDNGFSNPLEPINYDNSDKANAAVTNNYLLINVPWVKGLSYRLNTGYSLTDSKVQNYRGRNTQYGFELNGYANQKDDQLEDWSVENVLSYTRSFGKHNLFLTGVYSKQQTTYESLYVVGSGFPNDVRKYYQFTNAEVLTADSNYTQRSNESQMFRANYNYDSRYLFTGTVRRDGNSTFGENDKYGVFPSIALGWNIANESFLKDSNTVNELKLRASYGQNGNQALPPYRTLAPLVNEDYIDGNGNNIGGYRPGRLSSRDLGWETTTSLDLGLDFAFYNSRISGSIDVYSSKTSDLLLSKSIPPINGQPSILQNLGETKGSGFELALNTVNIATDNFKWTTNLAYTMAKNEIVNVALTDAEGNYVDDIGSKWFIGYPIDVNFGYVNDGVWQTDEVVGVNLKDWGVKQAGDVKYKDLNGDGKITTDDRQVIGSLQPDFTLGMTNSMTYKNFTLSFLLYWVEGISKPNDLITTDDWALRRNGYNNNYWSPTNPTNDFPENADRTTNPNSAKWFEDASFVRLKDVTLTYKLPKEIFKSSSLNNLSLFFNAKNLFTVTDWQGIDPEASNQRDRPFARTFILGLRLGL